VLPGGVRGLPCLTAQLDDPGQAQVVRETDSTHVLLVEAGLVEARGERKGRAYHLSAVTCRRSGLPSAYVRHRGFEPIQQQQMILQYV
jgi:ATP-dependent DNA helicase RecG